LTVMRLLHTLHPGLVAKALQYTLLPFLSELTLKARQTKLEAIDSDADHLWRITFEATFRSWLLIITSTDSTIDATEHAVLFSGGVPPGSIESSGENSYSPNAL
jgi:hypothetical protein